MGTASSSQPVELLAPRRSVLGLDAELLTTCVSCGLCLPHCPTFRVTGEERYSPRGRIDAMRAVDSGDLPVDAEFVDFVETCVQCRGCETACPSGVQFGALMEQTRSTLADDGQITPWWQRLGFRVLPRHRLLLAGSTRSPWRSGSGSSRSVSAFPDSRSAGSRRSSRRATTSGCSPGV
jgi:L-lactate utilization protein LutB